MRNVSRKAVDRIKTQNLCSVNSVREIRAVYDIMWGKNTVLWPL